MEKVESKVYFNKFLIHKYSDGSYSFENYAPNFQDLIECISWGRALQSAEKELIEAQKKIAKLQEQVAESLSKKGLKWAERAM